MAIIGHVERFEGDYLCGWALAPESTSAVTVIDAHGEILARGLAQKFREAAAPPYHFGFRLYTGFPANTPYVRVFGDNHHELEGSPIAIGPLTFDGEIQVVNGMIKGWIQERVTDPPHHIVNIFDQYGNLVTSLTPVSVAEKEKSSPRRFECALPSSLMGWREIGLCVVCEGVTVAKTTYSFPVDGYLDTLSTDHIAGWASIPGMPIAKVKLSIYNGDICLSTVTCDLLRDDLTGRYPQGGDALRCGFDVHIPELVRPNDPSMISLRVTDSNVEVFNGSHVVADNSWAVQTMRKAATVFLSDIMSETEGLFARHNIASMMGRLRSERSLVFRAPRHATQLWIPRVTIIIPIYRDVEVTRDCLNSVLAHRCATTDMIIAINDKSPDIAMSSMLETFQHQPNVWILSNPTNLGFVKTCNRGLAMASLGDVILLNSDTELFAGGLDELVNCASLSDSIGTVTPMSNNATVFTYPHASQPVEALQEASWPEIAAMMLDQPRTVVDVPTGHGFCLYIKRRVLDEVGLLDEIFGRGYGEENDFCQRAADLGYRNIVATKIFVRHRESTSFGAEKDALRSANLNTLRQRYPEYQSTIMAWEKDDPLRQTRWRVDRHRLDCAVQGGLEFVVVIANGLSGGTAKAIAEIEDLVGYGDVTVVRCSALDGVVTVRVDDFDLKSIYHVGHDDAELVATLARAKPRLVVVHQLLGYSAEFLHHLTILAASVPVVFFAHDFYAFCPRTTMIDAVDRFCAGADTDRCASCISLGGYHEQSQMDIAPSVHRTVFGGFLRYCKDIIVPSQDTADYMQKMFSDLDISVTPHPETRSGASRVGKNRNFNNVVLLGAIGPHKGSHTLLNIARVAKLDYPELRFHVVGHTSIDDRFKTLDNVIIHGRYKPNDLTTILDDINAVSALFLHNWPETYSYTLSEAIRHGMIPIVPDLGAPAERVRRLNFGIVVGHPIVPSEVLDKISKLQHSDGRPAWKQIRVDTKASIASLRTAFSGRQKNMRGELGHR
jgi:GT2 family glycosyltransferase/glycosyltransferase involved in cell wall biosynthesis